MKLTTVIERGEEMRAECCQNVQLTIKQLLKQSIASERTKDELNAESLELKKGNGLD